MAYKNTADNGNDQHKPPFNIQPSFPGINIITINNLLFLTESVPEDSHISQDLSIDKEYTKIRKEIFFSITV